MQQCEKCKAEFPARTTCPHCADATVEVHGRTFPAPPASDPSADDLDAPPASDPSADDLDAVAAEEEVKKATRGV